jgi:cytochrome b
MLILSVGLLFILAEFENLLSFHAALGFTVALLIIYRIIWGFMDVRYSKFEDFNFNLYDLKEYMFNILGTQKEYISHNPAASWAVVAMLILGLASVVSGVLVYGVQEGMGVLSFLNTTLFKDMEIFEDIHELITNAFMLVIFAHISGVLLDTILHKSNVIKSMKDGYKEGNFKSVELSLLQKLFGFLWIGSSVFLLLFLLLNPSNVLVADNNKAIDYKIEHKLFYDECISCHTLYPPHLLPKRSWVIMMDNLENHFGDDASLEQEDVDSIKEYLVENSGEDSTKEASFKILKSIKDKDTIAITKTSYWKKRHKEIDKSVFKRKKIGNISNCKACHKNIEQGLLNDKDIKIPQG